MLLQMQLFSNKLMWMDEEIRQRTVLVMYTGMARIAAAAALTWIHTQQMSASQNSWSQSPSHAGPRPKRDVTGMIRHQNPPPAG